MMIRMVTNQCLNALSVPSTRGTVQRHEPVLVRWTSVCSRLIIIVIIVIIVTIVIIVIVRKCKCNRQCHPCPLDACPPQSAHQDLSL